MALAKRIEAGLYAAELLARMQASGEKVSMPQRRALREVAYDGTKAKNHLLRPTCAWSSHWPSFTPAAAWLSWT